MKQVYQTFKFKGETLTLIEQGSRIIGEYQKQGFVLTLRQLYYQFVARGLLENNQRSYKRLGKIISNARLAGLVDWDSIEDRTRSLQEKAHWDSPADIVEACARQYRRDLWADQPTRVEVWIEKEALSGVIAKPCRDLDVPYFSCRGYVSQSEQREAGKRALRHYRACDQRTVILHLGDHDPSGVDMTRDNHDRLQLFGEGCGLSVKRLALTWKQIKKLNPPPNPAKFTDSRISGYVAKYGYESWELDALEPSYIDRLIRKHVESYIDTDLMRAAREQESEERQQLYDLADGMR